MNVQWEPFKMLIDILCHSSIIIIDFGIHGFGSTLSLASEV